MRCSSLYLFTSTLFTTNLQFVYYMCVIIYHFILKVKQLCDFPPEGGCFIKCATPMPCSHICPRICHLDDREHTKQKCHERCKRSCSVGHPCPKKCFSDCHPCLTRVSKILPCQHSQTTECFKDPETEYCLTKVIKVRIIFIT